MALLRKCPGPSRPHISSAIRSALEWDAPNGALAQLGEHLLCKQGVIGSIPIRSTNIGAYHSILGQRAFGATRSTRWVGSSGG